MSTHIRFHRFHRRGSVMILVVAVLGLLAVLGTVYIVAARTQRSASTAMNAAYNLDLARDAAMQQIVGVVGNPMYDSMGSVGGVDATGTSGLGARDFDYPEIGTTNGQSAANVNMRDEPWLAAHLHPQAAASGSPYGTPGKNDFTILTPLLFDPNTGQYDLNYSSAYTFDVVGEQTAAANDTSTDDPPTISDSADAYINLLSFSENNGTRYRVGYRIIDTNRMANLNTGCVLDSAAIGDTTGSYIASVRLAPPTGILPATAAYYNTADTATNLHYNTALMGRAGQSTTLQTDNPSTWEQVLLSIENPALVDPKLALFSLSDELELRSYGEYGTATLIRPALASTTSGTTFAAWPNTLNSNPTTPFSSISTGNFRRRGYTAYSFSRAFRPYPDPDTLKTPIYEFALNLTSGANDSAWQTPPSGYAIDANNNCSVWPANSHLQQVWVNQPIGLDTTGDANSAATNNDAMFNLAATASNLATIMRTTCAPATNSITPQDSTVNPTNPNVYTLDETASFVANYITYRASGLVQDPSIAAVAAYYLPSGPSFVDDTGICIRTAVSSSNFFGRNFGASSDPKKPSFNSGISKRVYLGYAAQPFINEIAAYEFVDATQPGNPTVVQDAAIELYNPYPVALSLNGYQLKCGGANNVLLTGKFVPANGYLVIVMQPGGHFATLGSLATPTTVPFGYQVAQDANLVLSATGGSVILYRPYFSRGNLTSTPDLAPVDAASYTSLVDSTAAGDTIVVIPPGTAPAEYSIQRLNVKNAAKDPTVISWGAAIDQFNTRAAGQTLGNINTPQGGGYELDDPAAVASPPQPGSQSFANISDFNRIMRIGNVFDASNAASPTPVFTIADKLASLATTTAPYASMDPALAVDSQIHFNFMAAPYIFNTVPSSNPGTIPSAPYPGDIRAVHLLDQISLIDRVGNSSISATSLGLTGTIDKIRLAGQINVNTASGDVLRAIPNMTDQMVANILAYRDRSSAAITYGVSNAQSKTYPVATYPGIGIRSLSELLVPIADATAGATTLQARDAAWANCYNLCTVRSDTFVVYGYMEAVRRNPRYTGNFDNATVWYGTGAQNVADDPNTPTAPVTDITTVPLIRLAQRRWVAIIDRSYCNYDVGSSSFTLPKVVAIKDLPQ